MWPFHFAIATNQNMNANSEKSEFLKLVSGVVIPEDAMGLRGLCCNNNELQTFWSDNIRSDVIDCEHFAPRIQNQPCAMCIVLSNTFLYQI